MKILSLFDGMSCGMIAFRELGIPIERYVAYEIDKYAVQTSQHNFPEIEHCGDVFEADFKKYKGFDFLVGGSPCTYWSIAQTKNRETVASGMGWELFSQYVRALREAEPKYFIYENNKSMSKAIKESITETFGFEPICINSALVSAQNRQRLYWVGVRNEYGTYNQVKVIQPEDRGILLKDVLETNSLTWMNKSKTIDANYYKGGALEGSIKCDGSMHQNSSRLMAANKLSHSEPLNPTKDGKSHTITASYYKTAETPFSEYGSENDRQRVAEPICVNSKSGRGEMKNAQPSIQDRIYDVGGKMTAVTTAFHPNIAEPIGCIQTNQLQNIKVGVDKSCTIMTIENHGWTNQPKTGVIEPINTCEIGGGTEKSRTLMAGYYKYGMATMITNDGFKGGATGVAERVNEEREKNGRANNQ